MDQHQNYVRTPLDTIVSAVISYVRENHISPLELISVLSGKLKVPVKVDMGKDHIQLASLETQIVENQETPLKEINFQIEQLKEELRSVSSQLLKLKQAQRKKVEQRFVPLDSMEPKAAAEVCQNPYMYVLIKSVDGLLLVLAENANGQDWTPVNKQQYAVRHRRFG